jgi:protein-tyrosine phosphatase
MWRGGYFAAPDAVEVLPGLQIGAEPGRRAVRALTKTGITRVVDLRYESTPASQWPRSVTVVRYPLPEYAAPSLDTLDQLSKLVVGLIQQGDNVYLHCRAGVQRAPLIACAVLVQMGWQVPAALQRITTRRGVATFSKAQLEVLGELPRRLEGEARPKDGARL